MTLPTALAAGALLLPVVALGATLAPSDNPVPAAIAAPVSSPTTPALNNSAAQVVTRSDPELEQTPLGHWAWPLTPHPQVVRRFAVGPERWSAGHRGVDLLPSNATAGVHAPANGVVHFAGVLAGRPVLSIDHGGGLISSFEPVVSTFHRGQPVQRDDAVGRLTDTRSHCGSTMCLHWGVRKDGRYIDPLLLLSRRRGPAVLLPVIPP
ncbi:MAG TPA: M23 family metallopeptidase [Kineosporiaceae bacterium]|nr:M23 family metallopeptidase [Kineosporiaceae bacterium]